MIVEFAPAALSNPVPDTFTVPFVVRFAIAAMFRLPLVTFTLPPTTPTPFQFPPVTPRVPAMFVAFAVPLKLTTPPVTNVAFPRTLPVPASVPVAPMATVLPAPIEPVLERLSVPALIFVAPV